MKVIAGVLVAVSLAMPATARAENVRSPSGKIVPVTHRTTVETDLARMKPMPMPTVHIAPPGLIERVIAASKARVSGPPVIVLGGEGSGLTPPGPHGRQASGPQPGPTTAAPPSSASGAKPPEYGASHQVYTTSQVAAATGASYRKAGLVTATGEVCSGAMIKKGLVVTAAHCIIDWNRGSAYGGWVYYPAAKNGATPYPGPASDGGWPVYADNSAYVTDAYLGGASNCAQGNASCDCNYPSTQTQDAGIYCSDDVALLALQPDANGKFAGDYTGWFGYSLNGASYVSGQVQVTQLGYPRQLDAGQLMERNDSRGYIDTGKFDNTVIGTLMSSGASGGPWVANFGYPPARDSSSVTQGSAPFPDILVGVTSWGYTCECGASSQKQNGASPFLSNTVSTLLSYACGDHPGNC